MSNYKEISRIIKQFSGQDAIITIPRVYVELLGDLSSALFLNQCVFWSDKGGAKNGWFYKSAKDWLEETTLGRRQVERASAKLVELGILETEIHRANGAPTTHYRVKMEVLTNAICTERTNGFVQNDKSDLYKTYKSLTDDYTDDYTDKEEEEAPLRKNIYTLHENLTGTLNASILPHLDALADKYQPAWIEAAYDEAALHNGRSLAYVKKILEGWERNGFRVDTRPKQPSRNNGGGKSLARQFLDMIDPNEPEEEVISGD